MWQEQVEFTIITVKHDNVWQQHVERSVQLPLPRKVLEETLRQAGFTHITFYSDYSCAPFEPDTANTLIAVTG